MRLSTRLLQVVDSLHSVPGQTPSRRMKRMPRTDIYLKVTVEHDRDENPEALASELIRQLKKLYVVRQAELNNYVSRSDSASPANG